MTHQKDARLLLTEEIPHLRRYARVLTRGGDGADDLVQSCLERALSRFHLWQQDRRLRPWLFTIMHNIFVNQVRSRAVRPDLVSIDAGTVQLSSAAEQEQRAEVRQVLAALDSLNDDQREAVMLVAVEGLSYEEAAQILGVRTGTLMSRLHRGRERLRELCFRAAATPAIRQVK
ncbi:sigma-70 family RNA polymerase sigma factor [Nisaea sediminum]|uniref:sigma-70 family RNA polymerase sigma factor n=1 Tax=Nisaea sediminum TaxID=2775867 RepID=UPI001D0062BF|nr:sigma-70 family RNA polymerase sigma factor [Nisaea sediminum]